MLHSVLRREHILVIATTIPGASSVWTEGLAARPCPGMWKCVYVITTPAMRTIAVHGVGGNAADGGISRTIISKTCPQKIVLFLSL